MATTQERERQSFISNTPPPSTLHEEETDVLDDYEETVSSSGFCCFNLCCFERHRGNEKESRYLLHERGISDEYNKETWLAEKLKKAKEVSEVLAGPKWKTFIRKLSTYGNNKKYKKNNNNNRFQYDPQSYALNFDGGVDGGER